MKPCAASMFLFQNTWIVVFYLKKAPEGNFEKTI